MHIFNDIRSVIIAQIHRMQAGALLPADISLDAVTVEPPRDASHGDMATNAAMVLAKPAKKNPREIAQAIADVLVLDARVSEVDIAGPGFINIRLHSAVWQAIVPHVLEVNKSFGNVDIGKGHKVNVEYVSANPTGPLHIGHARGAVYGDALCLLMLKAGYSVTKEYYVNDAGSQIDVLAKSSYLRYREACGEAITIPEGLYPGDYLIGVGQALFSEYGQKLLSMDEAEWLAIVKPFAVDSMMAIIRSNLKDLRIEHDVFTSEKSLHEAGAIPKAIQRLDALGLIYRGVLEPPKGKTPDDWEPREQLLFRSTDHGDDVDRALQKSDDSYTYFAADLALAEDKISRGYDTLVYMLGADHGGYKKRLEAAVSALSESKVACDVKLCQLVNLLKDGEPVKMSKRAGNFETVADVVEAVGADVLRFVMLTRKNDMVLDFDLDIVKEFRRENPVFYVQYAHARCKSLLRIAKEEMPEAWEASKTPTAEHLQLLGSDVEMSLLKKLAEFPRLVEQAALSHEPHRIAFYLQELAAAFHGLWNQGQKEEGLRFVLPDDQLLTAARLSLARAVAIGVASGLQVLGVAPLDELR